MRHDAERYRMLLQTENNPRVRKLLMDMIQELESRAALIGTQVTAVKDEPGAIVRGALV